MQETETMTARELWERLSTMDFDEQDAWLEAHEIRIQQQWLPITEVGVKRTPGTPLLLSTDVADFAVPMSSQLQVRPRLGAAGSA